MSKSPISADRYAVMGNPVAHSRSPDIQAAFAAQTGQSMRYERLLIPLDGFRTHVCQYRTEGWRGFNITVPFKMEAYALADDAQLHLQLSARAALAGAANTLRFDGNGNDDPIAADNTDGIGLVNDIKRLGFQLRGQRVLLLGAGGAARGVIGPILDERPAALTIANRSFDKAQLLADIFAAAAGAAPGKLVAPDAMPFAAFAGRTFDVIINGTSASLHGADLPLPDSIFASAILVYDMMYGTAPTDFLRRARTHGAQHTADGLGMLIEQAAEAFYFWRNVRPDTAPVHAQMRAVLQNAA